MNHTYPSCGVARLISVVCMALLCVNCMLARQFPPTDENGNERVYRIESASPAHRGMCVQDCSSDPNTVYDYRILPFSKDLHSGLWQLIPAGPDGHYRLKNCASGLYVSGRGTLVRGFYSMNATAEDDAPLFEFRPLSGNQFAITYEDLNGDTRYLCVRDSLGGEEDVFLLGHLENTRWAWYVRDGGILTGIGGAGHDGPSVSVVDRCILLGHDSPFVVFDLSGRKVTSARGRTRPLPPGIYMVYTSQGVHRVVLHPSDR